MRRLGGVLWLVLGAAVWNGFFDLYVSRGEVMGRAQRDGVIGASLWSVLIVGAGLGTLFYRRKTAR